MAVKKEKISSFRSKKDKQVREISGNNIKIGRNCGKMTKAKRNQR